MMQSNNRDPRATAAGQLTAAIRTEQPAAAAGTEQPTAVTDAEQPTAVTCAEQPVDLIAAARAAQLAAAPFKEPGAIKLIAPAKVNLFLDIGKRRADGYHEALSIMHALTLRDVLHMGVTPQGTEGLKIDLTCIARGGLPPLDVPTERNIVSKAVRALARRIGRDAAEVVTIRLEKHIPSEAGLGGGSSDAAAALVGAAHLWGLASGDPRIEEVARDLGADVAFFLHGGCACFDGVGDTFMHELEPMGSYAVLVKPEVGVSTAEAYRAFDAHPAHIADADRAEALAAHRACDVPLRNNLASASESLVPLLAEVRAWMETQDGVDCALMSGSGSAVFAPCQSFQDASRIAAEAHVRGWWARATMFGSVCAAIVP